MLYNIQTMNKNLFLLFIFILSACVSPQVTEETDCCLAVDFTAPAPAETQIPVQTPNQTQTAMVNEYLAFQTLVADFPSICNDSYYPSSPDYISPNGLWQEELCYSEEDQDLILTISNKETKILWKMFYKAYTPNSDVVLDGGMSVVHWSNDGKYAYFNSFANSSGGGCFRPETYSGWGLFRVDLESGNVNTILSLGDIYIWYTFSFSPVDDLFVYGLHSKNFYILNLGTEKTISVNSTKDIGDGGGIVWSPSGLKFSYSTIFDDHINRKFETTVRLVDIQTGNEQILLEDLDNCYRVKEWQQDNILIVESVADKKIIEFDLNTNTILSETPINP